MKILTKTLSLALLLTGVTQANAAVIYSGANRNIVYEELEDPGVISLFDSPGTWDDLRIMVNVTWDPGYMIIINAGARTISQGNYVNFGMVNFFHPKNFAEGELIDDSVTFSGDSYVYFSSYDDEFGNIYTAGEFRNQVGFVGIRLTDGDDVYYGWLRLSVSNYNNYNITATLIDWAYENTPGLGIEAGSLISIPEPTTTAVLFAGAIAAFVVLRRRKAA
jgi:hypothetical protein